MVKIMLISVLVFSLSGLTIRFLSMGRLAKFFKQDRKTLAWQLFHSDYPGALFNALFQFRLLRAGWFRWLLHTMMVLGFAWLVLVHALDDWTYAWFDHYQPGIEPFRFLRTLAGGLVVTACTGFLVRRVIGLRINRERRRRGIRFRVRGTLTIFLILGIIFSGIMTEGLAIMSQSRFDEMVTEYSDLSGEPALEDLMAYWERHYHVVFSRPFEIGTDSLAQGEILNQDYCLDCHTRPDTAVASVLAAKTLSPAGEWADGLRLDRIFYWIHFSLVMALLAFLPFSRMFHLVAIPLATARRRLSAETLRNDMGYLDLVGLSACTQCGFCTQVCAVFPDYQVTENPQVLPHMKIETLKRLAGKGVWDIPTLTRLRSGNGDCTRCGACADICPSGIDLVRLWTAADHLMDRLGCPDNYRAAMDAGFLKWTGTGPEGLERTPDAEERGTGTDPGILPDLIRKSESFEHCVQCTLCTNACPVAAYDLQKNDLGPHQIMNMLRLGKGQMASGSRMVWHCLTCYTCQEVCPQSIRVADILLELRCQGQERAARLTFNQLKGGGR